MIKRKYILALICMFFMLPLYTFSGGTGTWKHYMAYSNVQWIEKGGTKLYVMASDNLYVYNESDNSIQTFDKGNGLNGTDIDFIAWNNVSKRLVIVYADYNIDMLDEKGNIINVPYYFRKSMTENKKVNSLDMYEGFCYISIGFGIIKLNTSTAQISDTYNLGFNVDYSYIEGKYIYAASKDKGVYSCLLTNNLLDKNNWQRIGEFKPRNKNIDGNYLEKVRPLLPGGPKYNRFFFMKYLNDRLYSVGGAFEIGKVQLNQPGTIQVLQGDEWTIYQDELEKITGYNYHDLNCLAVDPKNSEHVFVGGRAGLYEFLNGKIKKFYNKDNSPLRPTWYKGKELGNDYVVISGMAFDKEGNLWVLNSKTPNTSLFKLSPDGKFTSYHKESLMYEHFSLPVMSNAMFDSRNLLWFGNSHWNKPGLFCYQPSTDVLSSFTHFVNQDNTTVAVNGVNCVLEDNQNNIWIGTSVGPLVLHSAEISKGEEAIFEQVKVPRNDGTNLADYLLSGVEITCMAIDGGGRKWFGTPSSGAYLISADNMTQVQHFLSTNSPLLSNNIESIAINDKTGEVFFGTDKGLCSYMSDASTPAEGDSGEVYAYPNPVKPGYKGLITVMGLANNSDVKVVTTNGVLVAQGRSNGGTFVWDGNDLSGKRVASGVYMVLASDQEGNNGTVCKIAIVN